MFMAGPIYWQPACPHSQRISAMSFAIWQCSLQYLPNGASFGTLHLQAG
jgi:hypothetical protein